jgi:DNA-binding SARP family transcriptional activator/ActR/RegA family two-component response regulator
MTQQSQILVVEDREDWQSIVCRAVEAEGHIPYPANSYDKAITALKAQDFVLAIVDPVLDREDRFNRDGLSVVQKICEVKPNIPVMIITGSLTRDLDASLKSLGSDIPVLFKEKWDPKEFSRLVHSLIGQAQQAGSARPVKKKSTTMILPPLPTAHPVMGRPRVLLVENRQDWQNIVINTLEEGGYFWRVATNAQEAQQELEQENFHLIILDLKLQEKELPTRSNEGWLLLDYLVQERPKTKVAILSGRASPTDVANLLTQYPGIVVGFIEKQNYSANLIREYVAQATQAPDLRIQTFGQFQMWRDGKPIGAWDRPQAETIVKLLLVRRVRGGRAVAADELITRLWPETDEESGRKKLLPLISVARHTLEPDIEPRDSNFILRSANGYFFDLSGHVSWDLIEFRQHLNHGQQWVRAKKWERAIEELEKGRKLYKGDFLAEDRYDDWAMDIRREIAGEVRDLLTNLADAYAALGNYPAAIKACEAALHKDPLLESVYRRLMRFHYCNGEKGQALKIYRNCLKLFEELFGESPTPATRHLNEMIANDQPIDCH